MSMHWTERRTAVRRIGEELRNRGWTLFGYKEDRSDIRTDYYAPASWDGVATHPELGSTIACVDVNGYDVEHSGKDDWPTFQATPHRKTWHVERDGEILYAGVGLAGCASSIKEKWTRKTDELVTHIERVAYGPACAASNGSDVAVTTGDYVVTVEHDRDWTWLFFDAKPPVEVRDQLKGMGARWGRKKRGWYFRRDVSREELTWLTGDDNDAAEAEAETSDTPLELARRLWSEHRPEKQGDAQRMSHDYVPDWLLDAIPALYSQDGEHDKVVWLKLFLPEGRWTFYATEYSKVAPDETPDLFFGYLASPLGPDCDELCYMTLEQIKEVRGARLRLPIERDLWWTPKLLSEVKSEIFGQDEQQFHITKAVQKATELHEPSSDLAVRAEEIKAREGQPCTVVVDEGEIVNVITPAWLYHRWELFKGGDASHLEETLDETHRDGFDMAARRMFVDGYDVSAEFCRFCRCAVQGALLAQERA
ncbi:MAG: DUF2958 domain-containing protein, partial [Chloroflexota bacterium]|nr:DUF2958 domain-containing protein [Chloroflexota bacterium]